MSEEQMWEIESLGGGSTNRRWANAARAEGGSDVASSASSSSSSAAAASRQEAQRQAARDAANEILRSSGGSGSDDDAASTYSSNSAASSSGRGGGGGSRATAGSSLASRRSSRSARNVAASKSQMKRRGLAQLEAATLGTSGSGRGERSKVVTSLRQMDKESSKKSLYSTGSHGSDDSLDLEDDDADNNRNSDGIAAMGRPGGMPSPRPLGGLGKSIATLQHDLHASSGHFGGLENIGDLQDLDAEELDRMHDKQASLELHTLAEETGGTAAVSRLDGSSSSTTTGSAGDGSVGGGLGLGAPPQMLQVRERANFLLGLADDNVPLRRSANGGNGGDSLADATSGVSNQSPGRQVGAKAANLARAAGRAGANLTHKLRNGSGSGSGDVEFDGGNRRPVDIDANYRSRRYRDNDDAGMTSSSRGSYLDFEDEYNDDDSRAPRRRFKRSRLVLALTVAVAAIVAFLYNGFFGARPRDRDGASGSATGTASTAVPNPSGSDDEARIAAIKKRVRDSAMIIVGDIDCKTEGPPTPQCRAVRWLALQDPAKLDTDDEFLLQRYALAVFWYSTFGMAEEVEGTEQAEEHYWTEHGGWMTGAGICSWAGIICHHQPGTAVSANIRTYDGNNEVTHLRLPSNNIKGEIPSEVFHLLTEMRQLDLSENDISGDISGEIRRMEKLQYLYLYNNQLTGKFPSTIGSCIDLREIDMSDNHLTGTLPPDVGQLRSLSLWGMFDNQLTGSVPDEIGNLGLLEVLYLDNNKLAGTIPEGIFKLPKLYDFRINKNALTGTIPDVAGSTPMLELLYLDGNELTGFIPKSLSQHSRLASLRLFANKLSGPLPSALGNLKSLDHLSLEYNLLSSTIPPEWNGLTHLAELYVQGNQLTGVIPTQLGQLSDLKEFRAHNNNLSGPIPTEVGKLYRLEYLSVENNRLKGTLPSQIAELEKLSTLRIGGNVITGLVHDEICELTKVSLKEFSADCKGIRPDIICPCCTECI